MADQFQTGYQALGSFYDEDDGDDQEEIPAENIIHVVPDRNKGMLLLLAPYRCYQALMGAQLGSSAVIYLWTVKMPD